MAVIEEIPIVPILHGNSLRWRADRSGRHGLMDTEKLAEALIMKLVTVYQASVKRD
jgi:hypothetical protein